MSETGRVKRRVSQGARRDYGLCLQAPGLELNLAKWSMETVMKKMKSGKYGEGGGFEAGL